MSLVLAVCALGVAIIVAVAVNEWRMWRRSQQVTVDAPWREVSINDKEIDQAVAEAMRRHREEQAVVFEWDWPAA